MNKRLLVEIEPCEGLVAVEADIVNGEFNEAGRKLVALGSDVPEETAAIYWEVINAGCQGKISIKVESKIQDWVQSFKAKQLSHDQQVELARETLGLSRN